ncbi:MAG: hypothetical protein U9Q92_03390 [archaeon]|nr:hypothetical protein [archaeon]
MIGVIMFNSKTLFGKYRQETDLKAVLSDCPKGYDAWGFEDKYFIRKRDNGSYLFAISEYYGNPYFDFIMTSMVLDGEEEKQDEIIKKIQEKIGFDIVEAPNLKEIEKMIDRGLTYSLNIFQQNTAAG